MLGHDNPTIIKHLEDLTGVKATTIPLDDPDTIGIFTDIHHLRTSARRWNRIRCSV